MHFQRTALSTSLALALGLTSVSAFAQMEEIYVTARKTEEGLQTTPVAVSAMNETMLVHAQVNAVSDLQRMAPSLSIMTGGTGSSALIFMSIRGNAQVSPSGGTDPAVATYVDGVYLARPTGGNVDMFDVGQAEVLRGPQGTLFGRNTTGGALNIHTNDPTGDFGGYVKGEYGNYNSKRVEAVVNIPILGEVLASRFAVRYNDHDGYGDYLGYHDPAGFNWNGLDREGSKLNENQYLRGKLKWSPTNIDMTATLGIDYSKMDDTGQRTKLMGFNPNGAGGFAGIIANASHFNAANFLAQQKSGDSYWNMDNSTNNPRNVDSRLDTPLSTNEGKGIFLEVEGDINPSLYAKSITAYRTANSSGAVDLDGTPLSLLTFYSKWDQKQWSQEFQLSGNVNEDLDWITGLYYFNEDSGDFSVNRFGGADAYTAFGIPAGAPQGLLLPGVGPITATGDNTAQATNTSYGSFVQANYHFTEKLRATLGFRYTFDRRQTVITSLNVEPDQPAYAALLAADQACKVAPVDRDDGVNCKRTQIANFQYPAWTFGMDYQALDNLFIYAKTSGASMAGGWNFRSSDNPSFSPENVRDLEFGFKSDLLDGTVRFNGALFYEKATDQQRAINVAVGVTPVQFIQNAGQSQATGAEFELTWLPWHGMQINSSLAFLNMKYEKYESTELLSGTGGNTGVPAVLVNLDRSNEHAPDAPKKTLSIGATQTFDTPIGGLDLHVDYHWVDETWFQDSTVNPAETAAVQAVQTEEKKHNSVPAYGLVNAQATLRTDDKHWEAALYVKNATDKEYFTGVSNFWNAFGTASRYYGDPRTYGASVRYNF
ncbi:MAG: hypothetical protein JWM78_1598 [Verrucomicrobiaceae bacterium]|nr:hypothetical protein [Verrucomicrobiaceae bacterium]